MKSRNLKVVFEVEAGNPVENQFLTARHLFQRFTAEAKVGPQHERGMVYLLPQCLRELASPMSQRQRGTAKGATGLSNSPL